MSATSEFTDFGGPRPAPVAPTAVEQFLGRLGLSDEMIDKLKTSMSNIDLEEYLDTARTYLEKGAEQTTTFVKKNPGKVIAGAVVLGIGTALLVRALRD
jgi:hypothetical protein